MPRGSDRPHELNPQTELTIKPETCWNVVWPPVEKPQEQEPKCGLVHEKKCQPRKYEDTTSSLQERNVDLRKFKQKNYVTGRWVLTIKTDKQGNFFRTKARWVLRGFQDKQKDYLQTDSPASTGPGFRMSCQMAANRSWDLFHIDLKTAFLQGQSYDLNRDVVYKLPPEAGHPPCIAARLKKPAYGMNDTPRRWWNSLEKTVRTYGMISLRTVFGTVV